MSSSDVSHLRGGHVAVQAGHDQPGREAVLDRQRLAVHADGHERVAPVEHGVDRASRR